MALLAGSMMPAALAAGFSVSDLTKVHPALRAALGAGYLSRAEPGRVVLTCPTCDGAPTIDVRLGRQTDGTEARVRSGETAMADLERLCRARRPDCRLARVDIAPAVGWRTSYSFGSNAGATAVVLRDGDLLTVRIIASDPTSTTRILDRLLPTVRAAVIGAAAR